VRACERARVAGREKAAGKGVSSATRIGRRSSSFGSQPHKPTDGRPQRRKKEASGHTQSGSGWSVEHRVATQDSFCITTTAFAARPGQPPASASPSLLFALLSVSKTPCPTPYHISSNHQACLLAVFFRLQKKTLHNHNPVSKSIKHFLIILCA
jgi:hypothetical protein